MVQRLNEDTYFGSQLPTPMSAIDLLDDSGRSNYSFRHAGGSGVSPAAAGLQSSTPRSDTPIGDVLSEARVSMEPSITGDVDADETTIKIVAITRKDPDPKERKDPQ